MNIVRSLILFSLAASAFPVLYAQTPDRWLTAYELSGYRATPRYDETLRYCRRLDSASSWVTLTSFGTSPQGRELPLLIVSKQGVRDPGDRRRTGIPVVLIQAGIHAGEIDGKDAGLMLVRDMAITRTRSSLLDSAIVLFIPIFNVDGHERFGPFNRINQNGPEEMGWRVTARNLNLNRDYLKADAPEMRALLRLFAAWGPDLYIDCHVTDGIDFQYDVTYTTETGPQIDAGVAAWISRDLLPGMLSGVERAGHRIFWYVFPREEKDLTRGMDGGASPPRFSTGYAALRNRAALLIETHVYKPYRTRVEATYAVLASSLERVNRTASGAAVRRPSRGRNPGRVGPEGRDGSPDVRPRLGERHEGVPGIPFVRAKERGLRVDAHRVFGRTGRGPVAVLRQDPRDRFGGGTEGLPRSAGVEFRSGDPAPARRPDAAPARARDRGGGIVPFPESPLEGAAVRRTPRAHRDGGAGPRAEDLGAGTVVIPADQPAMRVAVQLLEPRSADSFVAWGFFDAVFEQKEYFEQEVMERVGEADACDGQPAPRGIRPAGRRRLGVRREPRCPAQLALPALTVP